MADDNNSAGAVGSSSDSKKNNRTLFGILAYLWILIAIPFAMAKGDPFVKFHIKQGLLLLIIELIVYILGPMLFLSSGMMLMRLIHLILFVFIIFGIINVLQGKEKELPLIGHFAKYFKF